MSETDEVKTILRLTGDGRVTIPKTVRDALNLRQGDYLRVAVEIEKRADEAAEESPPDPSALDAFAEENLQADHFTPEKVVRLSEAERTISKTGTKNSR